MSEREIHLKSALKSADDFNTKINKLIEIMEKRTRSDVVLANLDRARKRLSMLRMEVGREEPINLSHQFFIEYKAEITARNEDFFTNLDLRKEYASRTGKRITSDVDFVFDLGSEAQQLYKHSTTTQTMRDDVYGMISGLLNACIDFKCAQLALSL